MKQRNIDMFDLNKLVVGILLFQLSLQNVSLENTIDSADPNGTDIGKSARSDASDSVNTANSNAPNTQHPNDSKASMRSAKESAVAEDSKPDDDISEESGRRFFLLRKLKNVLKKKFFSPSHHVVIGSGSTLHGSSSHAHQASKSFTSQSHVSGAMEGEIRGVITHPLVTGSLNIKIAGGHSSGVHGSSSQSNVHSSHVQHTVKGGSQLINHGMVQSGDHFVSHGIFGGGSQSVNHGVVQSDSQYIPLSIVKVGSHSKSQGIVEGSSHSMSHGILQGNSQSVTQGITQGNSKSASQGIIQGNSELSSQGIVQGNSELSSQGIIQGNSQSASQGIVQGNSKSATQGMVQGNSQSASQVIVQGNSKSATQGIVQGNSESVSDGIFNGNSQSASQGILQGNSQSASQGIVQGNRQSASHGIIQGNSISASQGIIQGDSQSASQGIFQGKSQSTTGIIQSSHSVPGVIITPAVSSSMHAKHSLSAHSSISQSGSHSSHSSGTIYGHATPAQTVTNILVPGLSEHKHSGQQFSHVYGASSHSAAQSLQAHGGSYSQQILHHNSPSLIVQPGISRTLETNKMQNGFHHQSSQTSMAGYNAQHFVGHGHNIQMLIPAEINSYLAMVPVESESGQLTVQQYRPNIQYYLSQLGSSNILKNILAIQNTPSFMTSFKAGQHNIHLSETQLEMYKNYLIQSGLINLEPYQLLFSKDFRLKLPTLQWTVVDVSPSELCTKPCSNLFERNTFYSMLSDGTSKLPLKLLVPMLKVRSGITKTVSGAGSIATGFGEMSQGVFRSLQKIPSQASELLKS